MTSYDLLRMRTSTYYTTRSIPCSLGPANLPVKRSIIPQKVLFDHFQFSTRRCGSSYQSKRPRAGGHRQSRPGRTIFFVLSSCRLYNCSNYYYCSRIIRRPIRLHLKALRRTAASSSATMASASRPKALFLSHGGGPCFFMKSSGKMNANSPAAEWYRTFAEEWPKPSAIVIISAHWEGRGVVRVTTGAKHPLFFDYYGFPSYTYELDYDCPGEPALAGRILELLRQAGLPARGEETRGYDHGVFIPLKLMYPEASIPVVQVSLLGSLDAEEHLKIGSALRPLLQDENILVVGSGQSTHNFNAFNSPYARFVSTPKEVEFVAWLKDSLTSPHLSPEERRQRLLEWVRVAPHARVAHPREEHLLPLHVVSAYTGFTPGEVIYDEFVAGEMSLASMAFWGSRGEASG